MNADHDFKIGDSHTVCQDYALSWADKTTAFAIVCDGCSSSADVDFGARVLAVSARETLKTSFKSGLNFEEFGRRTIHRADMTMAIFPSLNSQFLDSTLLVAWVNDGRVNAYMFGDGVFFHKTKDSVRAVHVDFKVPIDGVEKPAPAYLSYELDKMNMESYVSLGGVKYVYDCLFNEDGQDGGLKEMKPMDPLVITAPVSPGDIIAICSDGINSFKEGGVRNINWQELVSEFTGFKNFEGVFVRRRFKGFLRTCDEKEWAHSDDISMAAIRV